MDVHKYLCVRNAVSNTSGIVSPETGRCVCLGSALNFVTFVPLAYTAVIR